MSLSRAIEAAMDTPAEPKQPSKVDTVIDTLMTQLDSLDKVKVHLEDQLTPVLELPCPTGGTGEKAMASEVPLVNRLEVVSARLDTLTNELAYMCERLVL